MSHVNDKQKLKLGDRVLVHYDNSAGTITEVHKSGLGWLYTVRGDESPHFLTPNQLLSELTLLED